MYTWHTMLRRIAFSGLMVGCVLLPTQAQDRYETNDLTWLSSKHESLRYARSRDRETAAITEEYRKALSSGDDATIASTRKSITDQVRAQFHAMESARSEQIAVLEQRLERLKQAMQDRAANEEEIIARRVRSLLGETDTLDWDFDADLIRDRLLEGGEVESNDDGAAEPSDSDLDPEGMDKGPEDMDTESEDTDEESETGDEEMGAMDDEGDAMPSLDALDEMHDNDENDDLDLNPLQDELQAIRDQQAANLAAKEELRAERAKLEAAAKKLGAANLRDLEGHRDELEPQLNQYRDATHRYQESVDRLRQSQSRYLQLTREIMNRDAGRKSDLAARRLEEQAIEQERAAEAMARAIRNLRERSRKSSNARSADEGR